MDSCSTSLRTACVSPACRAGIWLTITSGSWFSPSEHLDTETAPTENGGNAHERYYRGMGKNRLEAFSDGVLAIVITIMVLELKVPHETSMAALVPIAPVFSSYVLSFVYIGIYWNNHHH